MVEHNARVVGSGIPALEHEIYGISQLDLFFLSFLNPKKFRDELAQFPRALRKDGFVFIVPAPQPGIIDPKALAEIQSMPSYFEPAPHYRVSSDKQIPISTRDLHTAAFLIHGAGKTEILRADFERAFELLESGRLIRPAVSGGNVRKNSGECIAELQTFFAAVRKEKETIDWSFHP